MLYCKWWEKPLEDVEEDAQEVCLHEGRACTNCSYIGHATDMTGEEDREKQVFKSSGM